MFDIVSDVAAPITFGSHRRAGRPRMFPFPDVAPGQSFRVDGMGRAQSARCALSKWKAEHPDQWWLSRKDGDGVRFWRVK